jgi:hypothetical protein
MGSMDTADQLDFDRYAAELADRARTTGQDSALRRSADEDDGWQAEALRALRILAERGDPFTADDLRARVGPGPSRGGLGAILAIGVRERTIRCVGFATSRRPVRRGGVVRIWSGRDA